MDCFRCPVAYPVALPSSEPCMQVDAEAPP